MDKKIELFAQIPYKNGLKKRLDHILVELFNDYSRETLKKWILNNQVLVNQKIVNQPDKKFFGGETILIIAKIQKTDLLQPENIPIDIVYEDEYIFVVNKYDNLVVHPSPGHLDGTLLNALLFLNNNIKYLPRSGIVHRLDKDTTGLMVVAKTLLAYNQLKELILARKMFREYKTIVFGSMISGGKIDEPIMRHSVKRKKMTTNILGKKSITNYRIINKFKFHTYLRIIPETGRTHQIRVHMSFINHPIVGDKLYYKKNIYLNGLSRNIFNIIKKFPRQALHSTKLSFLHPITKKIMLWEIDIPQDMKKLLHILSSY
ncbi:Ribosomal large subunit pseudouridine synthase D [Buchnera aphidicola (Eriosoma grossulariae)]|uniref:23S rRNA pseudouridine(1911/1915/1917) synthase RluD n=1 Tax=Buchnera aphidicola TaxID=9 RepID=UPI0034648668